MNDDLKTRLQNFGGSSSKPTYNFPKKEENKPNQPNPQYKRAEDKSDAKRYQGWNALLRLSALGIAGLGMYISAQFSVDGFNFSVDNRQWVGWGLACILVVIQSVWQKFGDNLTLFVMAMVCYAYGIITNVMGIIANRGGYDQNPLSLIVPVVFGILLEVFPEPVLAWAVSGDVSSDPLRKAVDRMGKN